MITELLFIGTNELFIIAAFVTIYAYSIFHVIRNPSINQTQKLLWILIILVSNILGALIYFLWGRFANNDSYE